MKFFFYLLLSIAFLNIKIFAQDFWQYANGPFGGQVVSLIFNSDGHIFAGTSEGVYQSIDNGNNWSKTTLPSYFFVTFAINKNGDIFAGRYFGIYRSIDNGINWTEINTGFNNGGRVQSLIITDGGEIFAGTTIGIFHSNDNGNNWTQTSLTDKDVTCLTINIRGDILAGTWGKGIYRSTDNGITWQQISIANNYVSSFVSNSKGDLFAGLFVEGGVYRSTDNGVSWTEINTGLPNLDVRSLAINSEDEIFVGTKGSGVFQSANNGASWTSFNTGLTNPYVWALLITSNGNIFAGTSEGVYHSLQPTTSISQYNIIIPEDYYLHQNYPNPFNPTTTIKYSIKERGIVNLTVFDILGREAAKLVNEEKQAGNYEVKFDGSGLSSGIYFYRLQSGSFSETRKLILLE